MIPAGCQAIHNPIGATQATDSPAPSALVAKAQAKPKKVVDSLSLFLPSLPLHHLSPRDFSTRTG